MVVTTVDGDVAPENVEGLLSKWAEVTGGPKPPGWLRAYLLRAGEAWRIESIWESREAIDAMRASGETPGAIRVFAAANAEPKLTIFEVEDTVEV